MTTKEKKALTFEEVLNSEHRVYIAALEHGSSDLETIARLKEELYNKTGYKYID